MRLDPPEQIGQDRVKLSKQLNKAVGHKQNCAEQSGVINPVAITPTTNGVLLLAKWSNGLPSSRGSEAEETTQPGHFIIHHSNLFSKL